jgi:glutathione synthase/RimK-type ligase-like ATP-grasp enzyme
LITIGFIKLRIFNFSPINTKGYNIMIIAIHPDRYTDTKIDPIEASAPRWAQYLRDSGHEVTWVEVQRSDILNQVKDCDGFMWRHRHCQQDRQIARRLLPVLEDKLGLEVYPDQATCWHYDDKISQYYLLAALDIPVPKTYVWFDYDKASQWLKEADYPMVIKLWSGAGSDNVRLVRDQGQAQKCLSQLFRQGVGNMNELFATNPISFYYRMRYSAKMLLKGRLPSRPCELHKNYILFQQFLKDNPFDTRITIIGNRAFGFRRFNRPGDFRASGSGKLDMDPSKVDLKSVRLAFDSAKKLGSQSLAFDILRQGEKRIIAEVSYTYLSQAVHDCPGHWEVHNNQLDWKPGQMWPEEAQIEDFLIRLKEKQVVRDMICV